MITMDEMKRAVCCYYCQLCCCYFGSQNYCTAMVRCLRTRVEGNPPRLFIARGLVI